MRWSVALVATALTCYAAILAWPGLLVWLNFIFFEWGFDAKALLAAGATAQQGLDVYQPMAIDPLRRPHSYSTWWLVLGSLGLGLDDTLWLSAVIVLLFLAAAFARLRPANGFEFAVFAAGLCSPPVILGLIRANNDLVIFAILSLVVPLLLSARPSRRALAALPLALATGLKFYPGVAVLVILAEADPRRRALLLGIAAAVLAVVVVLIWPDFIQATRNQPHIVNHMPVGAYYVLREGGRSPKAALALLPVVVLALALAAIFFPSLRHRPVPAALERDYVWFILGASLLVACFWSGISFGYRYIFALWLLPFLMRAVRADIPSGLPRRLLWTALLTLGPLLYGESLYSILQHTLWRTSGTTLPLNVAQVRLALQPLAWLFFGTLTLCVFQFAWHRSVSMFVAVRGGPASSETPSVA